MYIQIFVCLCIHTHTHTHMRPMPSMCLYIYIYFCFMHTFLRPGYVYMLVYKEGLAARSKVPLVRTIIHKKLSKTQCVYLHVRQSPEWTTVCRHRCRIYAILCIIHVNKQLNASTRARAHGRTYEGLHVYGGHGW